MSSSTEAVSVDGQRLWARLMALAEIGRRGQSGVDRAAFSPEDRQARRLLSRWGTSIGLKVSQDAIGNLFLRYPGEHPELPAVLTGSHLDSQPTGGRFDGAYGVLASLEAVCALSQAGIRPHRSIEVVAWSNEEGGRFAPGAMGSQVFAGLRRLEDCLEAQDQAGTSLRQALTDTLAELPEAGVRTAHAAPHAYLEAHIEQGPRLQRAALPVGVVTGIQGCLWLEYTVHGAPAHAGTTPLEFRRDAFAGAVALIETLRTRCLERSPECRFTVGRFAVEPNTPNTVPGVARFTVDFRDEDARAFEQLRRALAEARPPENLSLEVRELFCHPPTLFPQPLVELVAAATRAQHLEVFPLMSGAFHDALFLTGLCPTGMVFVRCRDGISHNPLEYAEPADVTAGAQVLTAALLRLASR
jgi:N-carbamoyl-L-amino-acid hydrolase